jgi:hypothetical protein
VEQSNRFTPQEARFLLQHVPPTVRKGVTLSKEQHLCLVKIPKFYGIPKIHKDPVKMRPIVPCHNALQNPVAKFVSKQLKPFIAELPGVCIGTKQMSSDLRKLHLPRHESIWIVSGDIVAYYPNIEVEAAIDADPGTHYCTRLPRSTFLRRVSQRREATKR